MVSFTTERSDTIRANLINHVAENPVPRRRRALWAVGLVLAGALTGAGASASAGSLAGPSVIAPVEVPPVMPDYGPAPEQVLALKPVGAGVHQPRDPHKILDLLGLTLDELRQFDDFRGLHVWSGESRYGTTCLLVAHPLQGLQEGIGDAQCSPDGIDTIADLTLCSECYAAEVFGDLPTGSLIRFVLKGAHVDVYVYVRAFAPGVPRG